MSEPTPSPSVIDTQQIKTILAQYTEKRAAQLLIEERKRFDEEREELRREITALRQQLAETAESPELQALREENAELRRQLEAAKVALTAGRETLTDVRAAPVLDTPVEVEVEPEPVLPEPEVYEPEPEPEPEVYEPEPELEPVAHYDPEVDGERRGHIRRKGNPVPVTINGRGWDEPIEGWVLDRGGGGLGLRLDQRLTPGDRVQVRSARQPTAPWIDIEIVYCQAEGYNLRVGCRFSRELSWPEQQQFG